MFRRDMFRSKCGYSRVYAFLAGSAYFVQIGPASAMGFNKLVT